MPIERRPSEVVLTGENPGIRLFGKPGGTLQTGLSFWRIIYSPVGPGHVLFMKSDLLGEEPSIYSDNVGLARWLQREIELTPAHCDDSLPVYHAVFDHSGDPRNAWTETIFAGDTEITCTWYDVGEPAVFHFNFGDLARPYEVYSVLAPAKGAQVLVNGVAAQGRVAPRDLAGTPFTSAALAFSETWLKAQK